MDSDPLKNVLLRLQAEVEKSQAARAALQESNPQYARSILKMRIQSEPMFRERIDGVCRDWIKRHAWPKMDPEDTLFVWDRIQDAHLFCGWLYSYGFRCDSKTEDNLLEFLLVHYWEANGVHRYRANLVDPV
jgi:hypothetical protein